MKAKFELIGMDSDQPIPNEIESSIRFQEGDRFHHENEHEHMDYIVKEVTFFVDDCDGQFYQLVSLQSAKYLKEMGAY